ncbi:hypothetical protein BH10PLA2_BH10PLA2_23680 [soil metagenome]
MAQSLAVGTLGVRLALSQAWWMWPDREIREALERVRFQTWLPVVTLALKKNAEEGKSPASFRELYKPLDRSMRSIERLLEGKHAITDQLALGMSFALGVPVCQMTPEAEEWIVRAACELSLARIYACDAWVYVRYLRARPRWSNPHLDPLALRTVNLANGSTARSIVETETTILRVAQTLGEVLEGLSRGGLA